MNTETKDAARTNPAYSDLREAIASQCLVKSSDGAVIIGSEKSGVRDSWIFDFRSLILQPKWLDRYAEIFWERYAEQLPFQVGGVETAGIPLVAAIVMKGVARGTPVNGFYIRKSRKRQGLMKFVEGTLTDEPIIFVDDLINSGQSVHKQLDILDAEGKHVSDVFTLLAFRDVDAYASLTERAKLTYLFTLADFDLPLLPPKAPDVPRVTFDIVWKYAAPNPSMHLVVHKSTPALDAKRVYFGSDAGVFRALNHTDGSVAWEFAIGRFPPGKGILSSPAIHDGIVYFGAYDGSVYALDAATGTKRWVYDDADWVGSSPYCAPEIKTVFVGLEFGLWRKRGGIAALDMKTGVRRWVAYHPELTHASPLYVHEESLVVIGSNDGVLYAYDADTGTLRWRYATRGDIKMRAAYDRTHRAIVCGSMNGTMSVIAAADGEPLLARELGGGIYSSPATAAGVAFVTSLDKCVYAIDIGTGKNRWVFETNGRIFASPIIADGSLWVGSNDGRLYELDPNTGKLRSFFQATERIVSAIALRDGKLYVPTVANELYCLIQKR